MRGTPLEITANTAAGAASPSLRPEPARSRLRSGSRSSRTLLVHCKWRWRVEESCTSELMAHDLVRLHRCCFAVWMLFFFTSFLHLGADVAVQQWPTVIILLSSALSPANRRLTAFLFLYFQSIYALFVRLYKIPRPIAAATRNWWALFLKPFRPNFRTTDSRLALYYESFRPD